MTVFKPQMMAGLMSRSGFLTVPCSLVPRERYGVTHLPLLLLFCLSSLLKVRSSVLAWKIPGTEEPCGLQSVGSWRVRTLWAAEHVRARAQAHNPLNGCSPHTTVLVVFTPPSIPVSSHHRTSSTLFPVFMATHELPGEGGLVLLFYRKLVLSLSFSADFPPLALLESYACFHRPCPSLGILPL